jgi:hypothetical protein
MYTQLPPDAAASMFYLVSCFAAVLAAFVSLMFGVRS